MKIDGYLRKAHRLFGGRSGKNVREPERWISLATGAALGLLALRRWNVRGVAVAAAGLLLRRGITGTCPLYQRLGLRST